MSDVLTAEQVLGIAQATRARFAVWSGGADGAHPSAAPAPQVADPSMAPLLAPLVRHWRLISAAPNDGVYAAPVEITPDAVRFSIERQAGSRDLIVVSVSVSAGAVVYTPATDTLTYVAREQRALRHLTRAEYRAHSYSYAFDPSGEVSIVVQEKVNDGAL